MIKTVLELTVVPYLWGGIFILTAGTLNLGIIWACGLMLLIYGVHSAYKPAEEQSPKPSNVQKVVSRPHPTMSRNNRSNNLS